MLAASIDRELVHDASGSSEVAEPRRVSSGSAPAVGGWWSLRSTARTRPALNLFLFPVHPDVCSVVSVFVCGALIGSIAFSVGSVIKCFIIGV